jgi:AraC-type DNA-binding domain-containing proteins
MTRMRLTEASQALTALVGDAPPVRPYKLAGGTTLTGRWVNPPYEGHVAPMNEHVVAATFTSGGTAYAKIDGKQIVAPCRRGAITLAPRGHDGDWRITDKVVVTNVYIGHSRINDCGDQIAEGRAFELLDRANCSDRKLFYIMKILADEVEAPQHHSLLFIEQMLDALCLQLIRAHSTLGDPLHYMQRGLARWQVKRVVAYMRDNIATPILLQDLANLVGMSRFHFCSAFRAATGTPPHEFLTRIRIQRACELLRTGDIPVKEVGIAIGYTTPSAFSATFHRVVGISPRDYRRNC